MAEMCSDHQHEVFYRDGTRPRVYSRLTALGRGSPRVPATLGSVATPRETTQCRVEQGSARATRRPSSVGSQNPEHTRAVLGRTEHGEQVSLVRASAGTILWAKASTTGASRANAPGMNRALPAPLHSDHPETGPRRIDAVESTRRPWHQRRRHARRLSLHRVKPHT